MSTNSRDAVTLAGLTTLLEVIPQLEENLFKAANDDITRTIDVDKDTSTEIVIEKRGMTTRGRRELTYYLIPATRKDKQKTLYIYVLNAPGKESAVIRKAFTSGVEELKSKPKSIFISEPDADNFV